MDHTETYVKMCQKATEIQGKPIAYGSYYSAEKSNLAFTVPTVGKYIIPRLQDDSSGPYDMGYYAIWLPHQDQLQEMVISGQEVYMLLCDFGAWVDVFVRQPGDARDYASMEQLWLAYVMWTKYGKKWSGSDWTKK